MSYPRKPILQPIRLVRIWIVICISLLVGGGQSPRTLGADKSFAENFEANTILTRNTRIEGNLRISRGIIDLAGRQLHVQGSLVQTGGTIKINGGTLVVDGDYRIQTPPREAGGEWTSSAGSLIMNHEKDSVLTRGGFTTQSNVDHRKLLTAGTLEVRGDFSQRNGTGYNFAPTGNHRVVLAGEQAQQIIFSSPRYSGFQDLAIANPRINAEKLSQETPVRQIVAADTAIRARTIDTTAPVSPPPAKPEATTVATRPSPPPSSPKEPAVAPRPPTSAPKTTPPVAKPPEKSAPPPIATTPQASKPAPPPIATTPQASKPERPAPSAEKPSTSPHEPNRVAPTEVAEDGKPPIPSVPYSPPRFAMPEIPFVPPLDINAATEAQYAGAVSMAMEGMRLIYGEMDEKDEQLFEAEWLPLFGQPSGEVIEYLNELNPLVVRYLAIREAINEAIDTYNAMALDFLVSTSLEDTGRALEILETFGTFWPFYERLQTQLETVVEQVLALGNPPEIDLEENRRRHRRHLDSFLGSTLVFGPCDSAAMAEDGTMESAIGFLGGKGESTPLTKIKVGGETHSYTLRFGETGLADGLSGRSGGAILSIQVIPDLAATSQDAWEILRQNPFLERQSGGDTNRGHLDISLTPATFGGGKWEGFLVDAPEVGTALSGVEGFVLNLETPGAEGLAVLWRFRGLGHFPSTFTPPQELIFSKHPREHAQLDIERTRRLAAGSRPTTINQDKLAVFKDKPERGRRTMTPEDDDREEARLVHDPDAEGPMTPPSADAAGVEAWYQAEKAALTKRQEAEIEYFRKTHEQGVAKTNRLLRAVHLAEIWKLLRTMGVEREGQPPLALFDGADILALASMDILADGGNEEEEIELPESLAQLAAAPEPELPTEPELTEEELEARQRQIEFHQTNIEHFQRNIKSLRRQIAATTDPDAMGKLRDNLMVNEANLQEQRDRITSIQSGQFVRTRTEWDAYNLYLMAAASSKMAEDARTIDSIHERAPRIIAMADPEDQPILRKFFDEQIASKASGEYTADDAKRIAAIIANRVLGEVERDAADLEDAALAADDLLTRAERVKTICEYTLMAMSTVAPYYHAHTMPYKFVQGLRKSRTAYTYATYQAVTGYIEGGVTEAFTRSATGYVSAYSQIGWVASTFKTAMDSYHQAVLTSIASGEGTPENETATGVKGALLTLGKQYVTDKAKGWVLGAILPATPEFKPEWSDVIPKGAKGGPPVVFERDGRMVVPERRLNQPKWPTIRQQLDEAGMRSRQANGRATVSLFRQRAERLAQAGQAGAKQDEILKLRDEMDQAYKMIKTDYFAKAHLNQIGRQGDSKILHYYNSRDRAYQKQLTKLFEQRMDEAGVNQPREYKSFSNSSSKGRAGMDLDLGVNEPPRYLTDKDGAKIPNPEHTKWRRSLSMRHPDGSVDTLDPSELQIIGQLILQDSFEELYGRPPGEAMVNFTTSYHPEAYRDTAWLGGKGSRGARIFDTDPKWTQQAADVSNFKLHHLPQDHPGVGRYGLMQEQSRGLVKDYDTKIDPMIKSGAHRNPRAAHHVRQIRDTMDLFAKNRIGPIEADRKIRELTGGYGIEEVGEQFSVIMQGLRQQLE